MENTGLFQQEQETRAKNHCTNLWPGYWILMRFFLNRDEGFWQKLENRATEKHIRVQFHNPEHTIRDDLRKYLDVLEKAICNSNVCQIAYAGKTRIVHPYKLTNQRSIWYLLATEENKLKSFSLAKIKWLDIKKKSLQRVRKYSH